MYGMNGYMANGYPMMADPNAYGHHAMTAGQMGGLASQYGYNLPPSAAAQMSAAGQMTTPSYMNGSSSYSYSMSPYMQVSSHGQLSYVSKKMKIKTCGVKLWTEYYCNQIFLNMKKMSTISTHCCLSACHKKSESDTKPT